MPLTALEEGRGMELLLLLLRNLKKKMTRQ